MSNETQKSATQGSQPGQSRPGETDRPGQGGKPGQVAQPGQTKPGETNRPGQGGRPGQTKPRWARPSGPERQARPGRTAGSDQAQRARSPELSRRSFDAAHERARAQLCSRPSFKEAGSNRSFIPERPPPTGDHSCQRRVQGRARAGGPWCRPPRTLSPMLSTIPLMCRAEPEPGSWFRRESGCPNRCAQ